MKERVRSAIALALLVVVVGAPGAASWHGLTDAGERALGLTGGWSFLVPLVLDAAAAYAAVLALRDVLAGDAAGLNRLLVWAYAVGSASLNAWWHDRVGGMAAALFYAAASISAVILWDRTLRALRRDRLREQGAVAPPTPRFRLARWLVDPKETSRAWRLAVLEGISDPDEAVRLDRALRAGAPIESARLPELTEMESKAEAVRFAFEQLGDDTTPRAVARWLADRGIEVSATYVADVVRRDRDKTSKKAIATVEPLRRDAS